MRVSTAQYYQSSIFGLQNLQSQLSEIQNKISSNKKRLQASDDPESAIQSARLQQGLASIDQYDKNNKIATAQNELMDSVLNQIVQVLNRAKELGIQSNNGALSSADKNQITTQLQSLATQLLDLENTKDSNGNYLFSGFKTSPPFTQNSAGVFEYEGDKNNKQQIQVGYQKLVSVNESGYDLFESITSEVETKSLLNTVNDLSHAIYSSKETTNQQEIKNNLTHLDLVLDHISAARTRIAGRLQYLDDMTQVNDAARLESKKLISQLDDIDFPAMVSELNLKTTLLQAAQASFAKISDLNLFNFLN